MKNVRSQAKERSPVCLRLLFTRRSCWGRGFRMAQPSAGLALFVCARIVKDTDVQNPRIIILSQIFNGIGSSQTCIFM